MKQKISFNEIKKMFNDEQWDVGVISSEQLLRCGNSPIKYKLHVVGADFSNYVHYSNICNTIVLIRDGDAWDYTHYEESIEIIKNSNFKNWFPIYTNFKEAAIFAGLGVRARNSLIYSYKFGFDCHICAISFEDEIIDLPKNKRVNHKLWKRCDNCDDCRKACPVGAIHNEKKPYWLNSSACDNFIGLSNDQNIPSVKKFWHENVYPEIPKNIIDKIETYFDIEKYLGVKNFPWDKNGYSFDGHVIRKNGKKLTVPNCRECTSQPRCSKWNGKYPYDKVYNQIEIKPIIFKRGWSKNKEQSMNNELNI
jgi:ferredoxin